MRSHTQRLMVCAASFAALCMGLAGCGSNTASTGGDSGGGRQPHVHAPSSGFRRHDLGQRHCCQVEQGSSEHSGQGHQVRWCRTRYDQEAGNRRQGRQCSGSCTGRYAEVPEVFTKGLLEDVTEEAAKYKSDFAEGPYSMMQVDGKTYGLPQDTGPLVYFYNQRLSMSWASRFPKPRMS